MKLHLPKSLLVAVLAACMVNTTAWGGWGDNGSLTGVGDVYYVEQSNIAKLDIATDKPNLTTLYIAQAVDGEDASGNKPASIEELILKEGDTLSVVTHPWKKDGNCNFSLLTINKLTIGDGTKTATFNVNAKQTVQLNSINGTIGGEINGTLKFNTGGNTTIDYETNRMTGSGTLVIMENSSLTLTGQAGKWGSAAAVSGNINVEAGATLYIGEETTKSIDLLGFAQDSTSDHVDSVTLTGSEGKVAQMIIRHNSEDRAGTQTLSTNINLKGYSSISGGTFETFGGKFTATGTENIITCNFKGNKDYTFEVTNEDDNLSISGSFSDGTSHGNAIKDGLGTLTLSASGNVFGGKYINNEGNSIINGTSKFSQGIEINGGEFTIGADIELGKAIVLDGGSLNLGTGHTITISSLDGFHFNIESGLGNSENGLSRDDIAYDIITGFSTSNVTGTATYKLGQNNIDVIDGKYTIQGNTSYFVNIGDVKTSSSAVSGATKFYVYAHEGQDDGNLIIDSNVGDIKAEDILLSTKGDGNITLKTNVSLAAGATSQVNGMLTIQDCTVEVDTSFTNTTHHNTKNAVTSLSSFSSVNLDNAVIKYIGKSTSLQNVTVETTGATLKFNDMGDNPGEYFTLAGVTNLKGLLTIDKFNAGDGAWKYGVKIEQLTGNGNISFTSASQTGLLKIDSLQGTDSLAGYSGAISMTKGAAGAATLTVTTGGSATLSGLSLLSGATAEFINGIKDNVSPGGTLGLGAVKMSGGSQLTLTNGAAERTTNITSLEVTGSATIGTKRDGDCWQGTININSLTNTGDSATLTLINGSKTDNATIFNINGGAFKGTINLEANSAKGEGTPNRKLHAYINGESVAQAAVINFQDPSTDTNTDNAYNYITLGVGADTVKIAGLTGTTTNAATIKSTGNSGTRTLEISTTQGADYITNAKVEASVNLVKSGEGTQTFTSDSIDSTSIAVNGGMLALTGLAELHLHDLVVKNGATLSVGNVVATVDEGSSNQTTPSTSVSKTATLHGGATINSSLDLSNASSLTLNGIGENSLVMINGDLILPVASETPTLTLSGGILTSLAAMNLGDKLGIFSVQGGFFVGEQVTKTLDATNGIELSTVFSAGEGYNFEDYYLGFTPGIGDEAGYSTVYIGKIVPEPTTATLSLLALAALAARRRRR